jgi:uncharacterized protein (DUF58 family)
VGTHLDRAKAHFGRDTSGMLEGGRYALVHTRSLEFDDLRPYVRGDDVRDIDWKASARSGHTLVKRFVTEKHHKILVVADAGRNTLGSAPSGESKGVVAANLIGAMGLITLRRSDEIGIVFGDNRGCVDIRLRRGETHVEYLLHRFVEHTTAKPAPSDIVTQLDWVNRHERRPRLIFVVSDEPDVSERLGDVVAQLTGRHDVLWAMVADAQAVAADGADGYDVRDGGFVISTDLGPRVLDAYRRAEAQRQQQLSVFMTANGIPHAVVRGSASIRNALSAMTEVHARAR